MAKFVIFASPRTGSTSLARVLGASPNVRMAIEPFHPGFPDWNPGEKKYADLITDTATLDGALADLFSRYDAIKVCDYQLPEDLYQRMLSRTDLRIMFLTRRNLAAMAVSTQIALQTSEWHKSERAALYDHLQPLDLAALAQAMTDIARTNQAYARYLDEQRPGGYLPLYYEDLYSEDIERNKQSLAHLCSFAGIALPPDEAIQRYMAPSQAKINVNQLYQKLPNYAEIVARFGNLSP